MLKVLGSFRLTLALLGVVALLFVLNPLFQPPATAPVKTGGANQAVLSSVTSVPQPETPAPSTDSVPVSNTGTSATQPASESATPPALPRLQPVSTDAPVSQSLAPAVQPAIQQVAAPVTKPIQNVVDTVTKPICVNAKLLTLKLNTCVTI